MLIERIFRGSAGQVHGGADDAAGAGGVQLGFQAGLPRTCVPSPPTDCKGLRVLCRGQKEDTCFSAAQTTRSAQLLGSISCTTTYGRCWISTAPGLLVLCPTLPQLMVPPGANAGIEQVRAQELGMLDDEDGA